MPVDYRWLTLKEGKKLGYSLTKVGNCVPCIVKDEDKCEAIGLIEIDGETMLARVGHGTRQCVSFLFNYKTRFIVISKI